MELLGASASHMRDMFSNPRTDVQENCKIVWDSPEVVFQRRMTHGPEAEQWQPVDNK